MLRDTDSSTLERFTWGYVGTAAGSVRVADTTRGRQLSDTAGRQISELIAVLSTAGETVMTLPCPSRGKLGDGTVAAIAAHTADSYRRIAGFLRATVNGQSSHAPAGHGGDYEARNIDLDDLLERLAAARDALALLAELSDEQLDVVPPAGDMKFCDGQRTLGDVVTSLLRHQGHQVDAVKAAVG